MLFKQNGNKTSFRVYSNYIQIILDTCFKYKSAFRLMIRESLINLIIAQENFKQDQINNARLMLWKISAVLCEVLH